MLRLEWATPAADGLEAAQTYYHDLNPIDGRFPYDAKRHRPPDE